MEFNHIIRRAKEIRQKYAQLETKRYGREWTKPEIALGLVGDIGDLMKLVTSKEGVRNTDEVDEELAHELCDCLWAVIILADKYGVNLEKSFSETMNNLEENIQKELS